MIHETMAFRQSMDDDPTATSQLILCPPASPEILAIRIFQYKTDLKVALIVKNRNFKEKIFFLIIC